MNHDGSDVERLTDSEGVEFVRMVLGRAKDSVRPNPMATSRSLPVAGWRWAEATAAQRAERRKCSMVPDGSRIAFQSDRANGNVDLG